MRRYLRMGHRREPRQHEGVPEMVREIQHRTLEIDQELLIRLIGETRCSLCRGIVEGHRPSTAARSGTPMPVTGQVLRDPDQQRPWMSRSIRRTVTAQPDEGLLDHVLDVAARRAQNRRAEINGVNHTWYCGAYWGWGFHEDGFTSALDVVQALQPRARRAA